MQNESFRFEVFDSLRLGSKSEVEDQKIIHHVFMVLFFSIFKSSVSRLLKPRQNFARHSWNQKLIIECISRIENGISE